MQWKKTALMRISGSDVNFGSDEILILRANSKICSESLKKNQVDEGFLSNYLFLKKINDDIVVFSVGELFY
jgi:hypothetical protein